MDRCLMEPLTKLRLCQIIGIDNVCGCINKRADRVAAEI
jgi:hypothetical protein